MATASTLHLVQQAACAGWSAYQTVPDETEKCEVAEVMYNKKIVVVAAHDGLDAGHRRLPHVDQRKYAWRKPEQWRGFFVCVPPQMESQMEIGTPYMPYNDAANRKSKQRNLGNIDCCNCAVGCSQ
jgi:hypothetical protein